MIELTPPLTAIQAARLPQPAPLAVVEPIVPRDPNAPAGPRPSFEITPMERLREARPVDDAAIKVDADSLPDTAGNKPADSEGADPDAGSADPNSPAKGTGMDIRA